MSVFVIGSPATVISCVNVEAGSMLVIVEAGSVSVSMSSDKLYIVVGCTSVDIDTSTGRVRVVVIGSSTIVIFCVVGDSKVNVEGGGMLMIVEAGNVSVCTLSTKL